MPKTSQRLHHFTESVIRHMTRVANAHGAINLSQGFPNFPASEELISLVYKYMKEGMNQYAPMQGIMPLREVLAAKMQKLYDLKIDAASEINIASGGTQAIYTAIAAFINKDDEVIVVEPAYDCYVPAIEMHGGKPVYTQLKAPDFRVDWNHVRSLITPRTRMIMINTPHNPTGAVLGKEDIEQLRNIVKGTNIFILSDEVYEHLVFAGHQHIPLITLPGMRDRCLKIGSAGKTFLLTGCGSDTLSTLQPRGPVASERSEEHTSELQS